MVISFVVFSTIAFSSCVTERVRIVRKDDPACKSLITRYDYGQKKLKQITRSNTRKNSRSGYLIVRNKIRKGYLTPKITKTEARADKIIYDQGLRKNFKELVDPEMYLQMSDLQSMSRTKEDLYNYNLEITADLLSPISEPGNVSKRMPKENLPAAKQSRCWIT